MPSAHPGSGNEPSPAPRAKSLLVNIALLSGVTLLTLLGIEIGYRVSAGLSVFQFVDWRARVVTFNRLGPRAVFDPYLGWRVKPWSEIEEFNTIDHGIRRNSDETNVRTGAVLAVGDSFTEGWDVEDQESWPAVLERLIAVPVVNAGIGGYGTDQIVLRAEELLPIVRPKILIVGFLDNDISRAGHSIFGAPKPHFSLENGALRYHPPEPLEPPVPGGLLSSLSRELRNALGYLAVADYLLARLAPNYWYAEQAEVHLRRANNDPAEVTCALLRRLTAQTDRDGIKTLLFMQYYAGVVIASEQRPPEVQRVMSCARQLGMRVVDQFDSLRKLVVANPDALKDYYIVENDIYEHMSAQGNRQAASLLSPALRDWLPALAGTLRDAMPPDPSAPATSQ